MRISQLIPALNLPQLGFKLSNYCCILLHKPLKYKIKLLLGTDAVHGDQHTIGTVLFPHNIGVSCSKNEANFENSGFWTRQGVKKSGFNFVFSPTVAVSHNPQWGRYYESMGQNEALI